MFDSDLEAKSAPRTRRMFIASAAATLGGLALWSWKKSRLVEVVAATDGVVMSVKGAMTPESLNTPVKPRADVVYLLDDRGWYYRYSHMVIIDPAITLGAKVKMVPVALPMPFAGVALVQIDLEKRSVESVLALSPAEPRPGHASVGK